MKRSIFLRGALAAVFTLALAAVSPAWAQAPFDPPGLDNAMAAKAFHVDGLMAKPGVVGVGVGLTAGGQAAVLIATEGPGVVGLPRRLDGVPVVIKVTGAFYAIDKPDPDTGEHNHDEDTTTTTKVDPTSQSDWPVPIGVSTGNGAMELVEGTDGTLTLTAVSCSAGTIGARLTDGTNFYALSNNHVYALKNDGFTNPADPIVQPGLFDTPDCAPLPDSEIGELHSYVPLDFRSCSDDPDLSGVNYVDVAIAESSTGQLDNVTPSDGYGKPSSDTVPVNMLLLDMYVQKYGRTTGLTHGSVAAIYYDLNVYYSGKGYACFRDQIIVEGNKGGFVKGGDSGSSVVAENCDSGLCDTVGLLFAGNRSGKMAIVNPIDWVLDALYDGVIEEANVGDVNGDNDTTDTFNVGLVGSTVAGIVEIDD